MFWQSGVLCMHQRSGDQSEQPDTRADRLVKVITGEMTKDGDILVA